MLGNNALDFMLVHGYTIKAHETLDPILINRLELALRLYRLNIAKHIIVAAKNSIYDWELYNRVGKPESRYMREYLEKRGIDSDVIFEEDEGTNTFECIDKAYKIIKRKGWESGIIISSLDHLERVQKIDFKKFHDNFLLFYFGSSIDDPDERERFRKHEEEAIIYTIEND